MGAVCYVIEPYICRVVCSLQCPSWSCHSLSEFFCLVTIVNMVVVKVQGGKKVTGPVASSLPVTVRDTARERQREVVAARLVQTHSMVAATVMLLVMSLTLLSLANFRDVGRENLCLRAQIAALQREKAMLECTARKFMRRDRRLHPGLPLHLPVHVDLQGGVRRVRCLHRPQEVLLDWNKKSRPKETST